MKFFINVLKLIALCMSMLAIHSYSAWFPQGWDKPRGTGFNWLLAEGSAPGRGLAGAGTALLDSLQSAPETNPALERRSLSLELGQILPPGIFSEQATKVKFVFPFPASLWGSIRLTHLGFNDLEGYNEHKERTGTYSAQTLNLVAATGSSWQGWQWGLESAFLMDQIEIQTYFAGTISLGVYKHWNQKISLGMSLQNLGVFSVSGRPDQTFKSHYQTPPLIFKVGSGFSRPLHNMLTLRGYFDARLVNNTDFSLPLGSELELYNLLILRTGYQFSLASWDRSPGADEFVTGGLGIKQKRYHLNYALQVRELGGLAHQWSLLLFL